ncbi:Histidine kinase [Vibrio sp. B1ASS3]|uniref:ATP-binding response regulator n=1 Tax=Vibrio sp. B1ASS3 TaxID=2751176 RepID=UPI001ABA3AEE|nr:response regulator [Vibrio sp. B1ASS3]CAD7827493.1 Histidine kinase [Vibrio sp. B1ASS3]CAE6964733.1 Histidine kinase [Vibrio sp. B1ASS3]
MKTKNKIIYILVTLPIFIIMIVVLKIYSNQLVRDMEWANEYAINIFNGLLKLHSSESYYKSKVFELHSKNDVSFEDLLSLNRISKDLTSARSKFFSHLKNDRILTQPFMGKDEFEIINNKSYLFYSRLNNELYRNADGDFKVYWREWSDLTKEYDKITSYWIDYLKEGQSKRVHKLDIIQSIQSVNILILVVLCFYVIFLLFTGLLNPIVYASTYISENKMEKISNINSSFSDFNLLIREFIRVESDAKKLQQYMREQIKEKTNFLNVMSHELRTPLNAMLGCIGLIRNEKDYVKRNEYIAYLSPLLNEMTDLVNNILTISKLESNIENVLSIVSTKDFVDSLVTNIVGLIGDKNIDVYFIYDKDFPQKFETDEVKLRRAILNVISNSIKAIHFSGIIKIRFLLRDEQLIFSVFDNGIGIESELLEDIVKPFRQVDYDISSGSSGLGLYVVKKFSDSLGGVFKIRSKKHKGTLCFLSIKNTHFEGKLKNINFDFKPKNYQDNIYIKKYSISNKLFSIPKDNGICNKAKDRVNIFNILDYTSKIDSSNSVGSDLKGLNLKVLIAEDYAMNIKIIERIVTKLGIYAEFAKDGSEAIELYKKNRSFDLIIMDLQMPKVNGFDAIKSIRSFDKDVIIIASSAHMESEVLDKLKGCEFNGFLQKPYTIDDFYNLLNELDFATQTAGTK